MIFYCRHPQHTKWWKIEQRLTTTFVVCHSGWLMLITRHHFNDKVMLPVVYNCWLLIEEGKKKKSNFFMALNYAEEKFEKKNT